MYPVVWGRVCLAYLELLAGLPVELHRKCFFNNFRKVSNHVPLSKSSEENSKILFSQNFKNYESNFAPTLILPECIVIALQHFIAIPSSSFEG